MAYPKQHKVTERLSKETWQALDALRVQRLSTLQKLWQATAKELAANIMHAYQISSTRQRKWTWSLADFRNSGAQALLAQEVRATLERFQASGVAHSRKSFNDIYNESLLRHAWMLDQVTPASRNVKLPHDRKLHESAVTVFASGKKSDQEWVNRWSAWSDAWQSSLMHNLTLGAMNKSSPQDAVAEIDATRANTPAYNLWDALARINDYEALAAASRGAADLADLNGDMIDEEIWKTRGDLRVCDDCDDNEGQPIDETGFPPLHPSCHCYPLIVPKEYAELLRNGSEDDKALAAASMDAGVVPNSIILRNQSGDIAGQAIVDFQSWKKEAGFAVGTQ